MKKYQALVRRIQTDIESGILKEGERLPSIREEAGASAVSINTVLTAYNILLDEGLIRSRERGGYYIRAGASDLTGHGIGRAVPPSQRYAAAARETGERLDQLYERLLHIDASFASAAPGPDLLPSGHLHEAAAGLSRSWMGYGHPEGDYGLRKRLAVTNGETDGPATPDDIVITNGATEAMTIVLRALLRSKDTIALESPTYMNFFRQLAPMGVQLVEIPVGPDGMDLEILEEELIKGKIRMIIAQPNVQNPTGITMSDGKKARLVALAEKYSVFLVQDDVYGDLFFGPFRPRNLTFYSDDPGIILVSSCSKTISPGLRVGWIRSRHYAGIFTEEKLRTSMDTCRVAQAILGSFTGTTAHRRHLRALRKALNSRIDNHIQRLSKILPQGSHVRRPSGGCLLWITLPPHIDATEVFEQSAGKGLIAAPGDLFSASRFFNNCIRLNAGRKLTKDRSEALAVLGKSMR
ncbi:PLP-dependent aminotransferase family protein [Desulfospira joergensenii]|uniref:aminotransferase-like domain-containing protein n=1 Tax=Desulfospira joergensenii TaxID=53329 RepID=UPI0003B55420|nr:PLP-dependent aminotransferase family protein [Desulfospira joergensenii]